MKTFVVIPVFNEEKNIQTTLENLKDYDYSIVVVDDGSKDNTVQLAKEKNVKVLKHKVNRGQGATLQTGTTYAVQQGADVVVHFDGDGQFLAQEIKDLIEPIKFEDMDVVLGSRFLRENKGMPWLKKYVIHPVSRVINRIFTGVKLTDVHCGFRALSKQAADKINISQDGMSHGTEIISQIKKYGLKFREVPVTVIYKEFGQGIKGGFKIIKELLLGKMIK
ncbi:MAG: glycosyltransferase family 2 protein [Candidatus Woesearchaeota archaeon]